jgi:A/G-specific adenine glycosylase
MLTRVPSLSEDAGKSRRFATFAARLIAWQRHAGRHHLPWQNARDPYGIWLSEVMLQQTQVATVLPYYERFLKRFPDVAALAAADADDVMAQWAGLGYYSRARNLHRAAQEVVRVHGGRFPDTAAALMALPGIGRSTAAAIAAFAFGERGAILDGNVKRVLCRVFGIERPMDKAATERELVAFAVTLLPDAHIASYTQGLMDLGATLCTTRRPNCTACPFSTDCVALHTNRIDTLPTPKSKRVTPTRRASFVLARHDDAIWLERRPERGIWGGLWSLPGSSLDCDTSEDGEAFARAIALQLDRTRDPRPGEFARFEHSFTHFKLIGRVWAVDIDHQAEGTRPGRWIALAECDAIGVPAPIKSLLHVVRDKSQTAAG